MTADYPDAGPHPTIDGPPVPIVLGDVGLRAQARPGTGRFGVESGVIDVDVTLQAQIFEKKSHNDRPFLGAAFFSGPTEAALSASL